MSLKDLSTTKASVADYEEKIRYHLQINGYSSAGDIVSHFFRTLGPHIFDNDIYITALQNLTERKEVVRLIFTPPNKGTMLIYFPKGTDFLFNDKR